MDKAPLLKFPVPPAPHRCEHRYMTGSREQCTFRKTTRHGYCARHEAEAEARVAAYRAFARAAISKAATPERAKASGRP